MVFRRSFTVTSNTIINNEGNKHDISTKQRQQRKRVSFQDRKNENKPKFPSIKIRYYAAFSETLLKNNWSHL